MMNIASLLSIKITSPITHMVSSAVRGVAASFLGMWLFHDIITRYAHPSLTLSMYLINLRNHSGRASSIAIILAGSMYYTWVKHVESNAGGKPGYDRVKMDEVEAGTQKDSKPE